MLRLHDVLCDAAAPYYAERDTGRSRETAASSAPSRVLGLNSLKLAAFALERCVPAKRRFGSAIWTGRLSRIVHAFRLRLLESLRVPLIECITPPFRRGADEATLTGHLRAVQTSHSAERGVCDGVFPDRRGSGLSPEQLRHSLPEQSLRGDRRPLSSASSAMHMATIESFGRSREGLVQARSTRLGRHDAPSRSLLSGRFTVTATASRSTSSLSLQGVDRRPQLI